MFDGEIVKKKFPFKKILDLENFGPRQSPQQGPKQSWTYKNLKMSCLMEKL